MCVPPPGPGAAAARAGRGALLAAALAAAALSLLPWAAAHRRAPPGQEFNGAFLFPHDVYNYLGYVQQAQDGAFLFRSRLTLEPHPPALVNLEWWAAGRLSRLLGRQPMLAWRLVGLAAAVALVVLADAWLRRAGLPASHRWAGLALVGLGGGVGGWLSVLGLVRADPLELWSGLFPVIELLANPHFVVGTALLMGALLLLSHGTRRGTLGGLALAAAAGLTRPYDLAMVGAVRALAVAATEPPRRWVRETAPLALLLPVVAYDIWLFHFHPAFGGFLAARYPPPPLPAVLLALAPSLGLAALAWRAPAASRERSARAHLWAWIAVGLALAALRPTSYSLQFLAGIGVPLLALGAVGLARWRRRATLAALAVLSSTGAVALGRFGAGPGAPWFVPAGRMEAARALGGACRPGQVALAPPEVGPYVLAFSSCVPFVAHPAAVDHPQRLEQARGFFSDWPPQRRVELLERHRVAALVLPSDAGEVPSSWLGPSTAFRRAAAGDGYAVYTRPPAPP